jgi:hypothetical protein
MIVDVQSQSLLSGRKGLVVGIANEYVRPLGKLTMAVVHPCDAVSLSAALDARAAGPIEPELIGPRARLMAVAQKSGLTIDDPPIEDVPHSHAAAAGLSAAAVHHHGRRELDARRGRVRVAVEPTNEEWIAASHAVRNLRKGAHNTTRSRAPATPAGSEA